MPAFDLQTLSFLWVVASVLWAVTTFLFLATTIVYWRIINLFIKRKGWRVV